MSATELRDAYKALKFLQEALAKSKEEVAICRSQLKHQEDQHLLDLQTLQAELNQARSQVLQPPAACQHHGQGLEALQRQYTNELKKLRDELDNAIQYRQRAEDDARNRTIELRAEKHKTAALQAQFHTLEASMSDMQARLSESTVEKASSDARFAEAVAFSKTQVDKLRSVEATLCKAKETERKVQDEIRKNEALVAQLHSLETSMHSLQTQLDESTTANASLEARVVELISLSNSQDAKVRSLEATLARTVEALASSQEACAALAKEKRRIEEDVVVARLLKVEELDVLAVHKSETPDAESVVPSSVTVTTQQLAEWRAKLRDLRTELRSIRIDVKAMKSLRAPILTMEYFQAYASKPSNATQERLSVLSAKLGDVRHEWHELKALWTAYSADTMGFLTDGLMTLVLERSGREAQAQMRRIHISSQLNELRALRTEQRQLAKTWQREVKVQMDEVMAAANKQIRIASRHGEGVERQLMASEDTTSPFFRRTAPSEAISWATLERRLSEMKTPFHRVLQSLDQANYALKLMIRNTDALASLGSGPMQSRVVEFARFIASFLTAIDDATVERAVATHSNSIHDLLYTWQPCDPIFLDAIPVPPFGIESPEVDHILSSWTSDLAARASAARWLSAVALNHPTNESSFRFASLTREVKDAVLVLLVPLIKSKRPVHVRLRRQSTTDAKWDIAIDTVAVTSPKQTQPQSAMFKAIQRRLTELQK